MSTRARVPRQIRHWMHRNHTLVLHHHHHPCRQTCNACGTAIRGFSYRCTTTGCHFHLHHFCASTPLLLHQHPYHPHHPLSLIPSPPGRERQSFVCRLCGRVGYHWLYRCALCPSCQPFEVHPGCAIYWMQLPRIGPYHGWQHWGGHAGAPSPSSNMLPYPNMFNINHIHMNRDIYQMLNVGSRRLLVKTQQGQAMVSAGVEVAASQLLNMVISGACPLMADVGSSLFDTLLQLLTIFMG